MTEQKSFKRLVRARMEKTSESYTAARARVLAGDRPAGDEQPVLTVSDDAIRERTGRGWEQWFDLLDEWDAAERPHREIARWVADQLDLESSLGWWAQSITVSYERARGGRAVGEHAEGFATSASKTVAVPVDRLFDAFVDGASRGRWLPDGDLRERTSTKPRSARFDWGNGGTRVHVTFEGKGEDKSTVTVSHERLHDARERDRMKTYWRDGVAALKRELEA